MPLSAKHGIHLIGHLLQNKMDHSFFFHELPVICFQISVFKRWIELALLMKGVLLAAFLNDQSVFAENVVGRFVR